MDILGSAIGTIQIVFRPPYHCKTIPLSLFLSLGCHRFTIFIVFALFAYKAFLGFTDFSCLPQKDRHKKQKKINEIKAAD